jgi:hypothetical protein
MRNKAREPSVVKELSRPAPMSRDQENLRGVTGTDKPVTAPLRIAHWRRASPLGRTLKTGGHGRKIISGYDGVVAFLFRSALVGHVNRKGFPGIRAGGAFRPGWSPADDIEFAAIIR